MTHVRARALGTMARLVGALLAAAGLLAGAASYGAPVEAGDCPGLETSVTGPAQLDRDATADYTVTVHNPTAPADDWACSKGMQALIVTTGSLRLTGTVDAGEGVACTEEPAAGVTTGGHRCFAATLKGGARAVLTVSVTAAEAGRGSVDGAATRLDSIPPDRPRISPKSLAVTVRPQATGPRVEVPTVRKGTTDEDAMTIQYLLRHHGADVVVDGDFGDQTERAVRDFQRAKGLAVDGVVGPQTWQALFVTVQQGSQGDAVRAAQSRLAARGADVVVDGDFGAQTAGVVRDFQRANGLAVDGGVGPQTWAALVAAD